MISFTVAGIPAPQGSKTRIRRMRDLMPARTAYDDAGVTLIAIERPIAVLALAGGIELDRAIADDVSFYNSLKAGQSITLTVTAHVAGAKTTHRRDSEGDVDAIVQTKSLIVHSVDVGN